MMFCFGLNRRLEHIEKREAAEKFIAEVNAAIGGRYRWEDGRVVKYHFGAYLYKATFEKFRKKYAETVAQYYREKVVTLEAELASLRSKN